MDVSSSGVWYVVGIVVTAVVGVLFGKNNLKRDSSATKVAEAQDSQYVDLLTQLRQIATEAVQDSAKMRAENEALRVTVAELDKRLTLVAMLHQSEEKQDQVWQNSGLLDPTRPLRIAPPRPPPARSADGYQQHAEFGRRAGDRLPAEIDALRNKFPLELEGWTTRKDET